MTGRRHRNRGRDPRRPPSTGVGVAGAVRVGVGLGAAITRRDGRLDENRTVTSSVRAEFGQLPPDDAAVLAKRRPGVHRDAGVRRKSRHPTATPSTTPPTTTSCPRTYPRPRNSRCFGQPLPLLPSDTVSAGAQDLTLGSALVFCKCRSHEPVHHLPGRERRTRDHLLHRPRLDPQRRDVRPQRLVFRDRVRPVGE